MKVRELMSSPAYTCCPQDTLEHAARQLWDHDCGMLPVLDRDGRVLAAITDRDICMGALSRGRRLADLRVADSMSSDVATCTANEDVAVVARRMAERQVHRLPVVDDKGVLCGIVTLNDLALAGERDVAVAACRHRTTVPAVVATPTRAAPALAKN
jgi:CBS-domain-containing membrane protein